MSTSRNGAGALGYELEITIDAPRATVWEALTAGVNAWWLPDFHMVGEGSTVSFDARAGGQLVETHANGGGLLWYTVAMVTPGESLHLVGHSFPEWGGPATSLLHLALEESDGHTTLRVRDSQYGHPTESSMQSLEEGWKQLFTEGLKRHVEG